MAWAGIPGFIASTFWFPFNKLTHIVTPVAPPVKDCEDLCKKKTTCCQWGVAAVRDWETAKQDTAGFTQLGWEIHGKDAGVFVAAKWCLKTVCTDALEADQFIVTLDVVKKAFQFKLGGEAAEVIGTVAQFPGRDSFAFYLLMVMTENAFTFFNTDGLKIKEFARTHALKDLMEDPGNHGEVTFVKSYSCGLFTKDARAATIRLNSDQAGLLENCGGEAGTVPTESNVDEKAAFVAALAKVNHQWSVDASAGSHGISFVSIVCAVLSSVSLVFLVFFVAKKNSHLEVAVADE